MAIILGQMYLVEATATVNARQLAELFYKSLEDGDVDVYVYIAKHYRYCLDDKTIEDCDVILDVEREHGRIGPTNLSFLS